MGLGRKQDRTRHGGRSRAVLQVADDLRVGVEHCRPCSRDRRVKRPLAVDGATGTMPTVLVVALSPTWAGAMWTMPAVRGGDEITTST